MYAHFWEHLLPKIERLERTWSIPYIWNCKEQRFHLIRRLSYKKMFRALSVIFALHMPFICWNLLQTLQNEKNIFLMICALGGTGLTSGITVVRWMYQSQRISGDIVKFVNAAVNFQKLNTQPGKTDRHHLLGVFVL
jgi:hypothetical protein